MIAILLFLLLQAAPSPDKLYEEYLTPETRATLERFDRLEQDLREAEEAARAKRTLALVFSIAIGLIPPVYLSRQAIREQTWKDNPAGTAKGLAIGLMGGAVLFALNYGVFLLKIRMGDGFNTALAFLLVAAMIAGALYLIQKKGDG